MSDRETIGVYDAKASEYAQCFTGNHQSERLTDFISRLPKGARVLDLGCGPGTAATQLAEAGCRPLAWDASREMVRLAARDPRVTAQQKVFDDLTGLAAGSLEGIWANFSLLHAPRDDVPAHLAEIARALCPDGIFLIAVKSGEGSKRDPLGRLYTYFSEDELRGMLSAVGFDVLRMDTGREKGLDGVAANWISLTAQLKR